MDQRPGHGIPVVTVAASPATPAGIGALYLDKPREVDRYDTAFTNIWLFSLDEKASQELITQVARELGK